jgi:Ferric reductase like transmembrane component
MPESRRSYGTGSLFVRADAGGREHWYAKWRDGGRQVKRKVGPKRAVGASDGFTRAQAERELRRLMEETQVEPVVEELSLEEAGRRHVDRLELLGRKRSTLMDYRSTLRVHLVPFFSDVAIVAITAGQIERYLTVKLRAGRAPKFGTDRLIVLHRSLAGAGTLLVLLHVVLLMVDDPSRLVLFELWSAPTRARLAVIATLALGALSVTSLLRTRLRLS